jgi:hypothetical protein
LRVTSNVTFDSDLEVLGDVNIIGNINVTGVVNTTSVTQLHAEDKIIQLSTHSNSDLQNENSVSDGAGVLIQGVLAPTTPMAGFDARYDTLELLNSNNNKIIEKSLTWNNNGGVEKMGMLLYDPETDEPQLEPYWEMRGGGLRITQQVYNDVANAFVDVSFAFRINAREELEILKCVTSIDGYGAISHDCRRVARFGAQGQLGRGVPQQRPDASPPTLSVASKTSSSITLGWVSNSNGDASVTGYELEYKKTSETGFISVAVVSPSHTLLGLESNTSYDFRVTKNTDMNNPVSSVVTDSTQPIEALPPTLSVTSKTPTSITLGWVSNSNGDAGLTGYELEYKKASETTFASVNVVSTTTSETLSGLESNTAYHFRVTKITDLNSPVSSVVTDSTEPIIASAPTLSVASKTVSSVSLSWVAGDNGDAGLTGYELEYKKASDLGYTSVTVVSTSETLSGLESNTEYHFRVIKNTNINSPVSSVVIDSTLITRRIDMYMTEHSVKYSSKFFAYNVKIDELLFYDVYGVKCEYEITIVNPNMPGEGHAEYDGVSATYFYDRLTQFYRGEELGWSVGWYIDPDLKQSFYDQIMISVQVPKNAFRMVTMFIKQDRSCGVFFDFPENPTGTPVFAHQTFDRETGGNIVGVMRDHYFTTDGTATGPPMFV